MKKPELVGELMKVMSAAVSLPCTVKCRLGVDNLDSYEFCRDFIKTVSVNGHVQHFIIHARKAFLKGLNPAENRNIPPLNYDYVYQLQKEFPELRFSLNGGIRTISQAKSLIQEKGLYGCMIGRGAYDDPWEMRHIDSQIYSKPSKNHSKEEVLYQYSDFVERM
jgi:tRNA-dihydrouridine synthase A